MHFLERHSSKNRKYENHQNKNQYMLYEKYLKRQKAQATEHEKEAEG